MRRGTKTVVAKELTAASAKSEFESNAKDVKKLLARLDKALKKNELEFRNDETNWGFVGSMEHVKSGLHELVRFIG